MRIEAVSPGSSGELAASNAVKLKDAAGQFEALLIAQMLKSARETDSGGWTGESDQSKSAIMDMAEQQLAELLGSQGSLGLARMVVDRLSQKK